VPEHASEALPADPGVHDDRASVAEFMLKHHPGEPGASARPRRSSCCERSTSAVTCTPPGSRRDRRALLRALQLLRCCCFGLTAMRSRSTDRGSFGLRGRGRQRRLLRLRGVPRRLPFGAIDMDGEARVRGGVHGCGCARRSAREGSVADARRAQGIRSTCASSGRPRGEAGLSRPSHTALVVWDHTRDSACHRALPPETVIVCDLGTPTPYLAAEYELGQARRYTIFPRAHGGWAMLFQAWLEHACKRICHRRLCGDAHLPCLRATWRPSRAWRADDLILFNNGSAAGSRRSRSCITTAGIFQWILPSRLTTDRSLRFWFAVLDVHTPDGLAPAIQRALSDGAPCFIELMTPENMNSTACR